MLLSLVIPVYNNATSLLEFSRNLQNVLLEIPKNIRIKIIFVNDGSTDQSLNVMRNLHLDARFQVDIINLSRNFGQLSATIAGLNHSVGGATIVISADLQEPTELISEMIHFWQNGERIVICHRQTRSDDFFTKITSRIAYFLLNKENSNIPIGGFDTFLIDALPLKTLLEMDGRFRFLQGDIMYLGFSPKILNYHRKKRTYGKSGYNFKARIESFINIWIDSSYSLIRFLTKVGIFIAFLGFAIAMLLIISRLRNNAPFNGFTFIACSILTVGGIQILLTGLLGEYIWRHFDLGRKRPLYIIESLSSTNIN